MNNPAETITDEDAARLGHEFLEAAARLLPKPPSPAPLPTREELEARIPVVLQNFNFQVAIGVVILTNRELVPPDLLRQQAEDILRHIAEMPNRTLVRGRFLTGLRLGSELILVLNCMCSYTTPKPTPDEPR